jgi:hypothetical protein
VAERELAVDVEAARVALAAGSPRNAIVACWMQLERDAAAASAWRRDGDRLGASDDLTACRAFPGFAAHAISAPDHLGWRTEQLANIVFVHVPRCSAVAVPDTTTAPQACKLVCSVSFCRDRVRSMPLSG